MQSALELDELVEQLDAQISEVAVDDTTPSVLLCSLIDCDDDR